MGIMLGANENQASENGKMSPVLATWDIRSGNRSAVNDERGLLAKAREMRVQSTWSIQPMRSNLAPIFTKGTHGNKGTSYCG